MKILVLTTKSPWPPRDGSAVASKCIIEGLAENGAEVAVLSIITQKHEAINRESLTARVPVSLFKRFFIDTTIKPIRLLSNLFLSTVPYDLERFYSPRFMHMIKTMPDLNEYDIIQCEGLVFALYLQGIRESARGRVILRAHNIEHRIRQMMAVQERFVPARWYMKILASRLRHIERGCRSQFDAIVTITNDDKQWFDQQKGDAPVVVAPTGATEIRPQKVDNGMTMRVGFIGALDWQPNIRALLWFIREVWPAVISENPQAQLFVAGRNASARTIKKISAAGIVYEGETDNAERFTSSMNLMIAPLFAGSGMRIKIIEAMQWGIPVVATTIAARGIEVTDRDDILIADDSRSFAEAVTSLLNNSEECRRISNNALRLLRDKYDNKLITSDLLGFYKVLTNDR